MELKNESVTAPRRRIITIRKDRAKLWGLLIKTSIPVCRGGGKWGCQYLSDKVVLGGKKNQGVCIKGVGNKGEIKKERNKMCAQWRNREGNLTKQ